MAGAQIRRRGRRVAAILVVATAGMVGCAGKQASPPAAPDDGRPDRGLQADEMTTGAVAEIDAKDLHGVPAARMEEMLEGRVAGVQIIRLPGGGISVRIRGRSSIHGNTEPLYVVDGMPVNDPQGRGLYWLNPADIQRIQVLKDASALSMYGVRGANGVVLITTRRGRR